MREFIKGDEDYLVVPITDTTGIDLEDDLPVEISIDHGATWQAAEWTGTAGVKRSARILLATSEMTKGSYPVWARLTDTPTRPIVPAGNFRVK